MKCTTDPRTEKLSHLRECEIPVCPENVMFQQKLSEIIYTCSSSMFLKVIKIIPEE